MGIKTKKVETYKLSLGSGKVTKENKLNQGNKFDK